ncbi:hypothetical protein AeMF1_020112 [Aphanomyces euteiches]|nr:hypothetical protein AeMF1_020112 [Aphanomyces euteiches]
MICDALWDIEADLDFLLPSNGKSNNVVVVGAAEESYTEEAQQTKRKRKKTRAPGIRKPTESRQRQEIFDLQHQVWMLENQLTQTASNSMLQTNMSQWERIARQQQGQMRTAVIENQNLQRAVDLNRSFISKMKAHSTKNPSLEVHTYIDRSTLNFSLLIAALACERLERVQVGNSNYMQLRIHAIADRQLERSDMEFINAGLVDETRNVW